MAKSPISADVKAANSKLAQFLRRKEEDEALLQIGKRKPKALQEEKKMPGGRARWHAEPDFRVPTPMVDRPRTEQGATSFHFSFTSISKQAVPTVGGKPIQGAFGKVREVALEHSKYIEREGAAEVSRGAGADHAAYVERPEAVESIDPSGLAAEAIERSLAAVINETPTQEEANLLGLRDAVPDGIPSVFSNISDDPFERQEYWRAVERCERNPKTHNIILDPESSPRWWASLSSSPDIDPSFKSHALLVAESYRQYLAEPAPPSGRKRPFAPAPYTASAERAGRLITQAMTIPGFDHSAAPLEFKSGRGGRIQMRFVAELPHELTAEDRALIVQNFCDRLASLEERKMPDGSSRKVGMMYTAVIHAPDAHNDSRNYHLHIVAHDRPAQYLKNEAAWDFEVQEHFQRPGREVRIRYPHRQNKIGEVTQESFITGKENSGRDFIPAMRREFSRITNTVLEARGIERRYDPRKYTEMGIERTPTEHLGTKAAALEAIGVPTVVGQLNAIAIWGDAERSIERQAKQGEKAYATQHAAMLTLLREMQATGTKHYYVDRLRALTAEHARLSQTLAEDRRAVLSFEHMEAKAKSRAIRTRQTCLQFLADIENGHADRNTRIMRTVIDARLKDAEAHLAKIDQALAPHRKTLDDAAHDIARRERWLKNLYGEIESIEPVLRQMLADHHAVKAMVSTTKARPAITPAAPGAVPTRAQGQTTVASVDGAGAPTANKAADPAKSPQTNTPSKSTQADEVGNAEADKSKDAPAEPIVQVAPMAIEGEPIVKPALDPVITPPSLQVDGMPKQPSEPAIEEDGVTPVGLTPLRPTSEVDPSEVQQASPSMDIETGLTIEAAQPSPHANPERSQNAADVPNEQAVEAAFKEQSPNSEAEPQQAAREGIETVQANEPPAPPLDSPEPAQPISEPLAPDAEAQPKIDRPRSIPEPSLFDLPEQSAPVKPGTSKAEQADWDALFNRIAEDRVPVKKETDNHGRVVYSVPSLDPAEQKILHARRFANRTNGRLEAIHVRQEQEISRLARWFQQNASDPSKFTIEGSQYNFINPREALLTLHHYWAKHPTIKKLIIAERDRRAEEVRWEKDRPKLYHLANRGVRLSREKMYAEAARAYPKPHNLDTPEAKVLVRLLRDLAPEAELKQAIAQVMKRPIAIEDVMNSTPELAAAFEHLSGMEKTTGPNLERQRDRDRGGLG